jgi:hypothetical protein
LEVHFRILWSFLIFFYLTFIAFAVRGQDNLRFERRGESYQFIERAKPKIIVVPVLDTRPVWVRALYSLRPWTMSAPGTRMGYNEELDLYELDGAIGVGIRGKVEF